MGRSRVFRMGWSVAGLVAGIAVAGCGDGGSTETAPRSPTAGIYDDFLESRKLSAAMSTGHADLEPVAREATIVEERKKLSNLEAGLASRRALLDDASRAATPGSPDESLYFQIWSSQLADGAQPAFRRLAAGGIEYGGKQFTKDVALRCAVPAQTQDYTNKPFFDCLKGLPTSGAAPAQTAAK